MITATIAGQVVSVYKDSLSGTDKVNEQTDFALTVIDLTGARSFSKNMPVEVVDDTRGTRFAGYINNQPTATVLYPNPGRMWALSCRDQTWLANKRTSNKAYKNQYAGTILVDLVQRYGSPEGLICKAGLRWEELLSDWQQGTLSGTVATTNASDGNPGDGDLELAPGASPLSVTTQTTSDWNTHGSSSSAFVSNNELVPANWQTIMYTAQCNGPSGGTYYDYFQIWSGSYTIQSSDLLEFVIWINAGSPSCQASVDAQFSDGTWLSAFNSGAIADQQNLLKLAPTTDLKGFADNQWYTRTFDLTAVAGKIIKGWYLVFAGSNQGTYTAYFRDISINNPPGNPGSALWIYQDGQSLNLNQQAHSFGYLNGAVSIVTAYIATASWTSAAVSLSSVGIYQSSLASYTATVPDGTTLLVESSADAGTTWYPVTSKSRLEGFLPGQSLVSTQFEYRLTMSVSGNDPTVQAIPSIVAFQFYPSYSATKSDVSSTVVSSGFSSGTLTNAAVLALPGTWRGIGHSGFFATNALMLNGSWRAWVGTKLNNLGGQTVLGTASPAQDLVSNTLQLTTGTGTDVKSEFSFAGNWQNFTASLDVQIPSSASEQVGLVYRTTNWTTGNNTYAYVVALQSNQIQLGRGSNTSTGSFTNILTVTLSLLAGSWHTLTVIVNGSSHIVQLDGVQYISTTDTTFSAAGGIGARAYNASGSTKNYYFNNFGVVAATSGSYQSPALSLNSVGTIGNTIIGIRTEAIPTSCSYTLQTSIDGGATWQTATPGQAIPLLTPGTSVVGKSLLVKILLSTTNASFTPMIDAFSVYISSAYSSSGVWSTGPYAYDSLARANQSGWGTATDQQTWALKSGSGTAAISNNTGTITNTGGGTTILQIGTNTATDQQVKARVKLGNTGSSARVLGRYSSASSGNFYSLFLSGSEIGLQKTNNGTYTTLGETGFAMTTGVYYWLHLVIQGNVISGNVWADGADEPGGYMLSFTDGSIASGGFGVAANLATGDTATFNAFTATRWPDPSLALLPVGRATSSLVNWNANVPTNTSLAMATSVDNGVSWQPVANPGDAIPGIATMVHYNAVRARSPLAFYRLNERSGSVISDSSNHGNTVDLAQLAGLTLGQPGALQGLNEASDTSVLFNGANGWIDLPISLNGNGLSAFSVSGWFKLSASSLGSFTDLLTSGTSAAKTGYLLYWSSTTSLNFVVGNGAITAQVSYATTATAGAWLHCVGTFDGSNVRFYVNGVLRGTTALSGTISASSAPVLGASTTHSTLFPGSMQGLAFFASTLQQADVTAIYTAGVAATQSITEDIFAVDSSADYTQSNFSGGASGAWTWDTTNGRLVGSGGTNGTLVNSTALSAADNQVMADFDQCDGSGLIANYVDANDCYFAQIWDDSGTGTQNSVKIFKRSGGVSTQLGSTVSIAPWTRGRFRRFILDVQAGVLTLSMDGITLLSYTDGSPLAAGKSGLLLGSLLRCIGLRIQQYGQDVTALSVSTRLTLTSTDPTATPQVLDLQTFVAGADIDPGALIPEAKYLRTYVSDNINDLNTKSGSTYSYVRPDKSVVFRQRTATPAPWILDSSNKGPLYGTGKQQGDLLVGNFSLTSSGDLYRNRQILTGVQATATFTESRQGDGSTRTWNLSNPLAVAPTILLNGQSVSVGVKNVDTGRAFYWQPGSKTIDQDSSGTLLQETDTLSFPNYVGSFTTEVVRDNAVAGTFVGTTSQAELAAIDQSSGIVENVQDVSKLNLGLSAAISYGDQLLAQYGVLNARTLTFQTFRDGLAPGQDLPAYVPEQHVIGGHFLIVQVGVSATIAAVPGGVLYRYSVVATEGPALGSAWKLLSSLLSK